MINFLRRKKAKKFSREELKEALLELRKQSNVPLSVEKTIKDKSKKNESETQMQPAMCYSPAPRQLINTVKAKCSQCGKRSYTVRHALSLFLLNNRHNNISVKLVCPECLDEMSKNPDIIIKKRERNISNFNDYYPHEPELHECYVFTISDENVKYLYVDYCPDHLYEFLTLVKRYGHEDFKKKCNRIKGIPNFVRQVEALIEINILE